MSSFKTEGNLRRTKSTSDLVVPNDHCINFDCAKGSAACPHKPHDSYSILLESLNKYHRRISALKQHNQKLRGMVKQQQSILDFVKNDTKISYRNIIASFVEESMKTINELGQTYEDTDFTKDPPSKQARTLLAAIELKTTQLDADMQDAFTKLNRKYLSGEERQDQVSKEGSVKLLKRVPKDLWPPSPDQSWKTGFCWTDSKKENRDSSLESTKTSADWITKLKGWSTLPKLIMPLQQIIEPSSTDLPKTESFYTKEPALAIYPLQPRSPQLSPTDYLLQLAVINRKISEGDYNEAFEEALSCCNLELVLSVCRAMDPAVVFDPCRLSQAVLMSLLQQLATDMLLETQLKCRYLEEALINLDVSNKNTRKHLPLVVSEVCKHLSKFVRTYPHHVAGRRISLIIMAASNLIK